MTETTQIVSKVLVHECHDDALSALKNICTKHKLVGLKVSTGNNNIGLKDASNEIDDVLHSNVDLGAIFLTEEPDPNGFTGIDKPTHGFGAHTFERAGFCARFPYAASQQRDRRIRTNLLGSFKHLLGTFHTAGTGDK